MGNILIADYRLEIVSRKQLVVAHIVPFNTHKGCVMVGLAITVPFLSANADMFAVFF